MMFIRNKICYMGHVSEICGFGWFPTLLIYTLSGSLKEFNLGMGHAQELEGSGCPLPLGIVVLLQQFQKYMLYYDSLARDSKPLV